jgi:predicted Fe-Mo cluster-binding NifX family protein
VSRVVHLNLDEGVVVIRCISENIGVSAIERLSSGGVRLVCTSSEGAARIRQKLKAYVIARKVTREKYRPPNPLW